jgi:hypothetical protein
MDNHDKATLKRAAIVAVLSVLTGGLMAACAVYAEVNRVPQPADTRMKSCSTCGQQHYTPDVPGPVYRVPPSSYQGGGTYYPPVRREMPCTDERYCRLGERG